MRRTAHPTGLARLRSRHVGRMPSTTASGLGVEPCARSHRTHAIMAAARRRPAARDLSRPSGGSQILSVGTAFHPRTAPLNRKMQWREWSGYFAASVYADVHDIEYNAIREAAALIDVSPLYKYDSAAATRSGSSTGSSPATRRSSRSGRSSTRPWCDEHGKVIDDGTVHRLAEDRFRWTAADPQFRWLRRTRAGLDVEIEDVSETLAAVALQGPCSRAVLEAATGESFADLRYFRRRASTIGRRRDRRHPDRLHRRPGLRAVDAGRRARSRLGRADGGRQALRHPAGRDARPRRRPARGRAHPARGRLHLAPATR